jgi:hypothetical protein
MNFIKHHQSPSFVMVAHEEETRREGCLFPGGQSVAPGPARDDSPEKSRAATLFGQPAIKKRRPLSEKLRHLDKSTAHLLGRESTIELQKEFL